MFIGWPISAAFCSAAAITQRAVSKLIITSLQVDKNTNDQVSQAALIHVTWRSFLMA
jgi:hypothetical protein